MSEWLGEPNIATARTENPDLRPSSARSQLTTLRRYGTGIGVARSLRGR